MCPPLPCLLAVVKLLEQPAAYVLIFRYVYFAVNCFISNFNYFAYYLIFLIILLIKEW